MRQAIIWNHVEPVRRRIYAALGGDELSDICMHFGLIDGFVI